jgi:hypothetical protein
MGHPRGIAELAKSGMLYNTELSMFLLLLSLVHPHKEQRACQATAAGGWKKFNKKMNELE